MMMLFRERDRIYIRIVSAYQPHVNASPYTLYQQHLQHYEENNNNKDYITNFDNRLSTLITDWIDADDQLLIIINANEDFSKKLWAYFNILLNHSYSMN